MWWVWCIIGVSVAKCKISLDGSQKQHVAVHQVVLRCSDYFLGSVEGILPPKDNLTIMICFLEPLLSSANSPIAQLGCTYFGRYLKNAAVPGKPTI